MAIKCILLFTFLSTTCKIVLCQTKANHYCSKLLGNKVPFHGIIGGTQTKSREFPHMAAVGVRDGKEIEWLCGGTLISPKFVLTAGHCTISQSSSMPRGYQRKRAAPSYTQANFRYVCVINSVLESNEFLVTGLKSVNHTNTSFVIVDSDISSINISMIQALLPLPTVEYTDRKPIYVFPGSVGVNDKRGTINLVRLGTRTLKNPSSGHQDIFVKKIINHPNYKPPSHYNDIALLELAKKVIFSRDINPACLLTKHHIPSNDLTAIGWGRTAFAGPTSDDLLKVRLQNVERNTCNTYFKNAQERLQRGIDDKLQLCADGGLNGARDTCQGDSGGPLGYLKGRQHFIAGITSFGKACGIASIPAVYTRVSAFVPWIESIVWQ